MADTSRSFEALDVALASVLDQLTDPLDATSGRRLRALDCGGGSGRRAVPLAVGGADVTVLDVSIDALAILARRAAEAGVNDRVHAVQADVDDLHAYVESGAAEPFDLVLMHDVLATTSAPEAVVASAAHAVRVGGFLSIVITNPAAVVIARALSGDLAGALDGLPIDHAVANPADPVSGIAAQIKSAGITDLAALSALVTGHGFEVVSAQGLHAISSLVPGAVFAGRPGAAAVLAELDRRTATCSPYREIAAQLHLLARRVG